MTDILVTSPFRPFTLPTQFKVVFNGSIYCGTVDAVDPSVSQVQVYLANEDGSRTPVAQPLRTNAGGFLVYNGQPAKFVTSSNHSLLVRDSLGSQLWYTPNMAEIDPAAASFLAIEALRRSYAEAGYNLVDGSFEAGGTLVNANDALLHEASGKAFSGPAGTVVAGADPTSGAFVDRSASLLTSLVKQKTNKQRINISAFGSTGTQTNGSNEAWDAALTYALSIAPNYTNQLNQGPWKDLSGYVFVSDTPIYPKQSLKGRGFIGATFNLNIILPDDFDKEGGTGYAYDFSKQGVSTSNARPMFFTIEGGINCRYIASGIYVNDFLHMLCKCTVKYYLLVGIETGTSGNELFLTDGCVIMQRDYASTGDASFPASVVNGYGLICRSGDCKVMGVIISYYKTQGIVATGNGMYLGGGSHIYAAGKTAFYQGESDGLYHVIDGANFDSSRVTLLRGRTIVRNCNVGLYPNTDSSLGIIIGANARYVKVTGNQFIAGSGADTTNVTPVYWNAGALSDKTSAVFMNQYIGSIINSDVVDRLGSLSVRGGSTAGTVTMNPNNVLKCRYDGEFVTFEAKIQWSAFTGGTGNIEIYGLPFVADTITPFATAQFTNNTNFSGATAVKGTTNTSIGLVSTTGSNVLANAPGVDSGYLCISGSYRPA